MQPKIRAESFDMIFGIFIGNIGINKEDSWLTFATDFIMPNQLNNMLVIYDNIVLIKFEKHINGIIIAINFKAFVSSFLIELNTKEKIINGRKNINNSFIVKLIE